MKTFLEIRESLEKLPNLQKGRAYKEKYAHYLNIIARAKVDLYSASVALPHADAVAPAPEYSEAHKSISRASKNAKQIAEKLKAHPEAIVENLTEKSIISLTDSASSSLSQCKKGWATQVAYKARQWKEIAGVVTKLAGAEGGEKFKVQASNLTNAIRLLEIAATKLPQDKADALAVQNNIKSITNAVADLDLETPFGKFLRFAADENKGAELDSLLNPEVLEAISKHNLKKSFRIYLT